MEDTSQNPPKTVTKDMTIVLNKRHISMLSELIKEYGLSGTTLILVAIQHLYRHTFGVEQHVYHHRD